MKRETKELHPSRRHSMCSAPVLLSARTTHGEADKMILMLAILCGCRSSSRVCETAVNVKIRCRISDRHPLSESNTGAGHPVSTFLYRFYNIWMVAEMMKIIT